MEYTRANYGRFDPQSQKIKQKRAEVMRPNPTRFLLELCTQKTLILGIMGKPASTNSPRQIRAEMRQSKAVVTPSKNKVCEGKDIDVLVSSKRKSMTGEIKSRRKKNDSDFVEEVNVEDTRKKLRSGVVDEVPIFYVPEDTVYLKTVHFTCPAQTSFPLYLKSYLSKAQLTKLKKTCFGYLLDLPETYTQPQLIRHLMARQIHTDKPNTFAICVNGTKLEFGLKEFGAISGLKCYGDDTCVFDSRVPNRIMRSYFPNLEKVPLSRLNDCIQEKRWINDSDAVKLSVLYVIYNFIYAVGASKRCFLDRKDIDLVESGAFEHYPWGKDSFDSLFFSVNKRLKGTVGYYQITGLSLALQIWFYECCSKVDPSLAVPIRNVFPRILKWQVVDSQPSYKKLVDRMFKTIGNPVRFSNYCPTATELSNVGPPELLEDPVAPNFILPDVDGARLPTNDIPPEFVANPQPISTVVQAGSVVHYGREIQKLKSDVALISSDLASFKTHVHCQFKDLRAFIVETVNTAVAQITLSNVSKDVPTVSTDVHCDNDQKFNMPPSPIHSPAVDAVDTKDHQNPAESVGAHGSSDKAVETLVHGSSVVVISGRQSLPIPFDMPSFDLGLTPSPQGTPPQGVKSAGSNVAGSRKEVTLDDYDFPFNVDELDANVKSVVSFGMRSDVNMQEDVGEHGEESSSDDISGDSDADAPINAVHESQLVVVQSEEEEHGEAENVGAAAYDKTPLERVRRPGKYAKSPFLLNVSSGELNLSPKKIFEIKHPFICPIGVEVDESLRSTFANWVTQGSTPDGRRKGTYRRAFRKIWPKFDFGVEQVESKEWFHILLNGGKAFDNVHIDVIFYYLRKKAKYGPDNPITFTTTDCLFKARVVEIYDLYRKRGNDSSVCSIEDCVAQCILGFKLLANVPWWRVDYILFPINVKDKYHWVMAVFNIKERFIWVYDSLLGTAIHKAAVREVLQAFSVMLPFYLLCTGFYGARADLNATVNPAYKNKSASDPLDVIFLENLPQQKEETIDCGVFVAAYAEYFSWGYNIPPADFDVAIYRSRLDTLLWDYARRKQNDNAISDDEVTGQQFRKKGGPTRRKFRVVR